MPKVRVVEDINISDYPGGIPSGQEAIGRYYPGEHAIEVVNWSPWPGRTILKESTLVHELAHSRLRHRDQPWRSIKSFRQELEATILSFQMSGDSLDLSRRLAKLFNFGVEDLGLSPQTILREIGRASSRVEEGVK